MLFYFQLSKIKYIILILLFSILFCQCTQNKEKSNQLSTENNNNIDQYDSVHFTKKMQMGEGSKYGKFFSKNLTLNDIELVNMNYDTINISNIDCEKDNYKFVFCYGKNACSDCLRNYFFILNEVCELVDPKNVLIIANLSTVNIAKINKLNYSLKADCYWTDDNLKLSINDSVHSLKPYMFILDSEMKTSFPKVGIYPDSVTSSYFRRVISQVSKKQTK